MFTWYSILILAAGFVSSDSHPIDPKVVLPVADGFGIVVLGTAFLITTVVALIACSCCKQRRDGFKEFQNAGEVRDVGYSNALSSELSIFPPPGGSPPTLPPTLPPTSATLSPPSRPAAFSAVIPSISDWFTDSNANFPRQQLFYQKEIGKGWFGKVVKGEGRGVKVVVRILREDATPEEKAYFLHEARPFRDLRHKNIARLFGRCLENDPYLLLFHFSANGDLKSFLVTNSSSRNAITEQNISLKMMLDVTNGLKFMNDNGFIHTDLAARNCLVGSDVIVKIGDYGTSIDKYKNEYYVVGDMAVPIRWCAPETLTITSTTIQTNQVTEGGNVWSLGVLLWEISEFGKLPYSDLSDEQVILQVLSPDGNLRLPQPTSSFGQYLHHIMSCCWKSEGRATVDQVLSMLVYLKTNPFQEQDFEARWRMLKPNTVAVVDNHTPIHSPRHTLLAQRPRLPAKLEFDSGVDLEIKPTDENPDSCRTSTPITVSPQLSVASEEIFQATQLRSPSLTNLKGSLEDVTQFDSWLTGVEQKTEEDRKFAKNISEAIKNLDETLALEKTSSSSADSSMDASKKPLLEFRLGPQEGERKGDSLSSDTEEETWRKRIERGEFSEKVKEKSKSVTDLMVLTHIESEGSESDSLPSLSRQCSLRKGGVTFTGVGFGSEGNIRNAVLSDELQEKLRQLALWKTDTDQSFLGIGASETIHYFRSMGPGGRKVPVHSDPKGSEAKETQLDRDPIKLESQEVSACSDSKRSEVLLCRDAERSEDNKCSAPMESESKEAPMYSNLMGSAYKPTPIYSDLKRPEKKEASNLMGSESKNAPVYINPMGSAGQEAPMYSDPKRSESEEAPMYSDPKRSESEEAPMYSDPKRSESEEVPMYSYPKAKGSDSQEVTRDLIEKRNPCINSILKPVNNMSVMNDTILEAVNTTSEDMLSNSTGTQVIAHIEMVKECKILESELDSSQSVDKSVPKIVITESELSNHHLKSEWDFDEDPQVCVNIKPRKFVFICRDLDDDEAVERPSINDFSICTSEPKINCSLKNISNDISNSSVILGACNEHTLDYFQGLKTTFMPAEDLYSQDFAELNDVELICDESVVIDNLNDKRLEKITGVCQDYVDDYPLPDLVPEVSINNFKSSTLSDALDNFHINDLIKKSIEQTVESKLLQEKSLNDDFSLVISSSAKDISDEVVQNPENDGPFLDDEKHTLEKNMFTSDRTLNSNDSLSTDSPVAGRNILNSTSSNTSDSESNSSSVNSSEEQLVEAPYPFNQPLLPEHYAKSKSLDSFLIPKNDLERINELMNGVLYENSLNATKHFVPVFNMSESVSENAFLNQNAGYDKYFSIDSGHSSDRCMEQDKQMNDLKNRLEDVAKSGSDFQLKNSEEEYGGKLLTPDDERSSDSGFRDKGSLSESVEDTCDEKYNLEDIDAELDDYTSKSINNDELRYYEQLVNERDSDNTGWFLPIRPESSAKENGWVPQSTENEESLSLSIDAEFAAAIRNELKEKLPCVQHNDKSDEDNSPRAEEQELNTESATQFAYPSQLSPILEEQESNQSSLQLNDGSPTFLLPPPESITDSSKDDNVHTLENIEITPSNAINENLAGDNLLEFTDDKTLLEDCVLIVDTETNEATLIESPQPHTSFIPFQNGQIVGNGESPEIISETFILTPDNAPSTPNSVRTDSHSSPENGNMSGFFLSPCSVRSDLFDSGPPSLPFDLGQSLEEVEELPIHKVASLENITYNEGNNENHLESVVLLAQKHTCIEKNTDSGNSEIHLKGSPSNENVVTNSDLFSTNSVINDQKHLENNIIDNENLIINDAENFKYLESKVDTKVLYSDASDDSNEEPTKFKEKYFYGSIEEKLQNDTFLNRNKKETEACMNDLTFPDEIKKESLGTSVNLSDEDWPALEELLPCKLGVGITSTLALLSPGAEGESGVIDGGPLPSPEDGWRPTISQLMELTEADGEEMTTSFIDPDPNGTYTPDWESDISESSSSGEFLWKEGDKEDLIKCVPSDTCSLPEELGPVMERIEEEDEDCSSTDSESSSEGSASTEFRPSTWNSLARPLRPILRTRPLQREVGEKRVVFKKEKYQCVYEYPREDSDSEEESCWQTPASSLFDFPVFTDWELGEGEVPTRVESVDSDSEESKTSEYDFYRLDYNPTSQLDIGDSLPSCDTEFSPLAADLTPVRLGDLKHTKATLRLELPSLRPDQGEASILESAANPMPA